MTPLPVPKPAVKIKETPAKPISEALPEVTVRLEKMAADTKEFTRLWHEWFATLTAQYNCPEHREEILTVDPEESILRSWVGRKNLIAFKPCQECQIAIKNARENHILESRGVPLDMLHCCFANFKCRTPNDSAALEIAKSYAANPAGALILIGQDFGVGKSHLAVAIMRVVSRKLYRNIKFTTHAEFIKALRDGYNNPRARDIIEDSIATNFLVMDDLGVTSGGRDEIPAIHTVLDERKSSDKPFVLTSNAPSLKALEPMLGRRMMDRLKEITFGAFILSGASMRKKRF